MPATRQEQPPRYGDLFHEESNLEQLSTWERIAARRIERENREAERLATEPLPLYTASANKYFIRTDVLRPHSIATTEKLSNIFTKHISNAPLAKDLPLPFPPTPARARYEIVFPPGYNDVLIQMPTYKSALKLKNLLPNYIVDYPANKNHESEPVVVFRRQGASPANPEFYDTIAHVRTKVARRVDFFIEALASNIVLGEIYQQAIHPNNQDEIYERNMQRLADLLRNNKDGLREARKWVQRLRAFYDFAGLELTKKSREGIEAMFSRVQRLEHRAMKSRVVLEDGRD
ncbi:hypothetical protein MBLNU230_g7986t1 [Neophaeotheca triangularis]